jgi:hypothetical protein
LLRSREQNEGLILRTFAAPALVLSLLVAWMQVVAPRYLIILLPGAALGTAAGLYALYQRRARFALVLAAALFAGLLVYRLHGSLIASAIKPWSSLAQYIERQADPTGDVVLCHPPWDERIFDYYYHGPALRELGAHDYDTFYYEQQYHLRTTWTSSEAQTAIRGNRRVWVFYDPLFHSVPRLNLPYKLIDHWDSDGLELYLYEVPAE